MIRRRNELVLPLHLFEPCMDEWWLPEIPRYSRYGAYRAYMRWLEAIEAEEGLQDQRVSAEVWAALPTLADWLERFDSEQQ